MTKEFLDDELILGMSQELVKQASDEQPNLVKAAECLHAALEILEEQGLHSRADQVLQLLEKIAKQNTAPIKKEAKIHSLQQLMEAGITQRDLKEFARGNPMATAKLNLVLRKLGVSDHEMAKFLGPGKVMSEEAARKAISPNEPGSLLEFKSLAPEAVPAPEGGEALEFMSLAVKKKPKNPGRPDKIKDWHTKGLTPEKELANLKHHGTPFNMANDGNCAVDVPPPIKNLTKEDMEADFADLLNSSTFDIDASDDELMGMEIKEDSLEVSENDLPLEDFEDERD